MQSFVDSKFVEFKGEEFEGTVVYHFGFARNDDVEALAALDNLRASGLQVSESSAVAEDGTAGVLFGWHSGVKA